MSLRSSSSRCSKASNSAASENNLRGRKEQLKKLSSVKTATDEVLHPEVSTFVHPEFHPLIDAPLNVEPTAEGICRGLTSIAGSESSSTLIVEALSDLEASGELHPIFRQPNESNEEVCTPPPPPPPPPPRGLERGLAAGRRTRKSLVKAPRLRQSGRSLSSSSSLSLLLSSSSAESIDVNSDYIDENRDKQTWKKKIEKSAGYWSDSVTEEGSSKNHLDDNDDDDLDISDIDDILLGVDETFHRKSRRSKGTEGHLLKRFLKKKTTRKRERQCMFL